VVHDLNLDKLRQLASDEPKAAWLEKIRPALQPGELNGGKLNLRPMTADDGYEMPDMNG
jgi:hypothetical protein